RLIHYPGGYGYEISHNQADDFVKIQGAEFVEKHSEAIDWVVEHFSSWSAADLEVASTLLFVHQELARKQRTVSREDLVSQVREIKPRYSQEQISDIASRLDVHQLLSTPHALTER